MLFPDNCIADIENQVPKCIEKLFLMILELDAIHLLITFFYLDFLLVSTLCNSWNLRFSVWSNMPRKMQLPDIIIKPVAKIARGT